MIDMVYEGYHKVFKDREPLKREHFIPCYFMTDKNIKKYLNVPDEMAEEFDETCFKLADDKILHAKAFDHITELFTRLNSLNIRIGINSSRSFKNCLEVRNSLGKAFDFIDQEIIISSDMVKNPKPDPESLFLLEKRANLKMKDILFVGDSYNDSECAKGANCDFGLAVWGLVSQEEIEAKYHFNDPLDILKLFE